jgi:hypothetical protein
MCKAHTHICKREALKVQPGTKQGMQAHDSCWACRNGLCVTTQTRLLLTAAHTCLKQWLSLASRVLLHNIDTTLLLQAGCVHVQSCDLTCIAHLHPCTRL